ncbi:ribonuclease E inhibitor RraB [Shewanella surugensis]|uniref:Regulator of ribonuclease activity B n=1 Tax=Shewanella surugensis TaxID=212020 RepID=A0ABT0L6N2_9GAMM|nr:ribonuclease E inhibitor RraB [Shewanella surugensis]MCL1123027.1 ribonuclease E inhibitor RraB [Shewanella surugensis]
MSIARQLELQKQENRDIVEAMLVDGSDPDAQYSIEHHFSSTNFDKLEKAAVEAFKLGFDVNDAEEMELEDGSVIFCFDAISTHLLEVELLDDACEKLLQVAAKQKVDYDGWGTHFMGDEDEAEDEIQADSQGQALH